MSEKHQIERSKKHPFSSDRAIEEIPQDRLGRSFFASKLADGVCNWKQNDSLVLAIYGEWGMGKTSLKNLFKCHCKEKGDPYIAEFNPWQWSAQDKIFEAFFKIIGERLQKVDIAKQSRQLAKKWKYYAASLDIGQELGKQIVDSVTQLLGITGGFSILAALVTNSTARLIFVAVSALSLALVGFAKCFPAFAKKTADYFEAKAANHEKETAEHREELITELRKLQKPLIVIIDDLDRLNKDEIKVVIQLVKANTDLPNVVFLLLFQEEFIAKALDEPWQKGRDYLEKIIQVGFDIPSAPQSRLHKILFEELNEILDGLDMGSRWDKERWDYVFGDYLKDYFQTLRDVYRFISMLRFHIGLHRNGEFLEVNPIDLILLHTLRVFEHPAFERIRDSSVSDASHWMKLLFFEDVKEEKGEKRKVIAEEIVKHVDEHKREKVKGMITELFPQVGPNFSGDEKNWDRDLRICHQEHFPKYFELALRDDAISLREISTLIRSSHDSKVVAAALDKYVNQGRIDELLGRIGLYVDTVATENIASFLGGFLETSERFPGSKPELLDVLPIRQAVEVLKDLLLRLPEPVRLEVMSDAFNKTDSFTLPAFLINVDARQPNPPPMPTPLLGEENSAA
jgi:predicted KAP-like P-loop ATPase